MGGVKIISLFSIHFSLLLRATTHISHCSRNPFIKGLKRLKLGYVVEVKDIYTVRTPCKKPKLTPKGRLAKNQYDLITLPKVFKTICLQPSMGN